MSIYNYSQYITKSLYLLNIGSPLFASKGKETCIPISVKEEGWRGRGGSAGWRRKPRIWELPSNPPFPTLSLLCLFQKQRILYLSESHTTQQMCKDWEGWGGRCEGLAGWRGQPRILGPFSSWYLGFGGLRILILNITIKY
jgi:hypothetical protein